MRRFTSCGQGAAAWMATLWDERSKPLRSSSGSFNMRVNMVGTHWLWVTRWSSMACSACTGSKRRSITTVPPSACTAWQKPMGAEW